MKKIFILTLACAFVVFCGCTPPKTPIKALIVTGQNNHNWVVSYVAIKQILENSGLFRVDIAVTPPKGGDMRAFSPKFSDYQLVVLDYNGDSWTEETNRAFLDFVQQGRGGVVVYHAADNAFRHWKDYNLMLGFGGWEGRDESDGPYMYMQNGRLIYDASPGRGGSHGQQHEFVINTFSPEHPVTKGLPARWLHAKDELYDRMRGPGDIKDVLGWSYSNPETGGSGRDELTMFTVAYGGARVFHTVLGHAGATLDNNTAMQCTGFQVTLLRGAEWAATGKVTQPVPADFPTETTVSFRNNYKQL